MWGCEISTGLCQSALLTPRTLAFWSWPTMQRCTEDLTWTQESICNLSQATEMSLQGNRLERLPSALGSLQPPGCNFLLYIKCNNPDVTRTKCRAYPALTIPAKRASQSKGEGTTTQGSCNTSHFMTTIYEHCPLRCCSCCLAERLHVSTECTCSLALWAAVQWHPPGKNSSGYICTIISYRICPKGLQGRELQIDF